MSTTLGITVLGSGSRGNALVVHTRDAGVLIDAGFSARELDRRMAAAGIDPGLLQAIVVSHEHDDHVRGLNVYVRQRHLPVYINRPTAEALRSRETLDFPVTLFATGTPFSIGTFAFEPFSIPHDATDPVGFVIRSGPFRIGLATDLGHVSHLVCHQLRACDLLMVESNHDMEMLRRSSRPWSLKQRILGRHGHLSNDASMELLSKVLTDRTRYLILAHASIECNRYELVERCARQCLAALGRDDVTTLIAVQNEHLQTVWL